MTGNTYACFEPSVDYMVVKFPKWAFDKFVYAKRTLGTQMKATGEVMSIGTSFEQAMMKAVRSVELGLNDFNMPKFVEMDVETLRKKLHDCDDERIFCVYAALKKGISAEEVHGITMIDCWFLNRLKNLIEMEESLKEGELTEEKYLRAKELGFLNKTIEALSGQKVKNPRFASYKMVDTCAAEFAAETPYFYSVFDKDNEAEEFIKEHNELVKNEIYG